MKKLHLIPIILVLFIFQRCSQQETPATEKTKVSFSLSSDDLSSARVKSSSLDDVTTVVANLASGGTTLSQRINLMKFGDTYATEPIELTPGTYTLTDFFLENDSANVLFATPHSGSPLAPIVKHPLSINFTVALGKSTIVAMEVVPVDGHSPHDFGYASFGVLISRPLSISAFTVDGTPKLASAKAYILDAADTIVTYTLGAKVNLLSFKLEPDSTYKLVIIKDGFTRFTKTFVYSALADSLQGYALKVYLKPALSLNIVTDLYSDTNMAFTLTSTSDANIIIDWGDGTSQAATVALDDYHSIFHNYPINPASYYATISGDLSKIKEYYAEPVDARVVRFNFDNASGITGVNLFSSYIPPVLDLRKRTNIEYIVFGDGTLLLPDDNRLTTVVIWGEGLAPQLDDIISNIYRNAVDKNIYGGQFYYAISPDSDEDVPLGTPSAESIEKLSDLYYSRGWDITPAP